LFAGLDGLDAQLVNQYSYKNFPGYLSNAATDNSLVISKFKSAVGTDATEIYFGRKYNYEANLSDEGVLVSETQNGVIKVYRDKDDATVYYVVNEKGGVVRFPQELTNMFNGYSSLKRVVFGSSVDTSRVTSLYGMFNNCSKLEEVDFGCFTTVNVTTMRQMFNGCTSLKTLNLTSFNTASVENMYSMFSGCSSLKNIYGSFDMSNVIATSGMFNGCKLLSGSDAATNIKPAYLTFTANEDNSKLSFSYYNMETLEYNVKEGGWENYTAGTEVTLNKGESVQFRGILVRTDEKHHFVTSAGSFAVSGDVTSLSNNVGGDFVFNQNAKGSNYCSDATYASTMSEVSFGCAYMFSGTNITTAPNLPTTVLTHAINAYDNVIDTVDTDQIGCYEHMFQNCTMLSETPSLNADTLSNNCYAFMFDGCTALKSTPELFASKSQKTYCCAYMFSGCTALTTAYPLRADNVPKGGYSGMFMNCTSLVTAPLIAAKDVMARGMKDMFKGCTNLTTVSELTANEVLSAGYSNMFENCTALTEAPAINATTIGDGVYWAMFKNCTSLTKAPSLYATTLFQSSYQEMFKGCISLETAPALPAKELDPNCYQEMFSGCVKLKSAPTLAATNLKTGCYQEMFKDCTALTETPELLATTLATDCYRGMFSGCTGLTTVPSLPATTLANNCYMEMFKGCTGLDLILTTFR